MAKYLLSLIILISFAYKIDATSVPNKIEIEYTNTITLSPNPAVEYTRLKSNTYLKIKNVEILDIVGNQMYKSSWNNSIVELNVSSLRKGKYFVKVLLSDNSEEMIQLIKQ